ncbi:MAG TPA: hypothetical protein EYN51_01160 [Flavobacteriales bacterium]|nr:hypothetical protein [Flavobacteriales bacterium]
MIQLEIHYVNFEHPSYKYRTIKTVIAQTGIMGYNLTTEFFRLYPDGTVEIFENYAWDGCSGVPDLKSTMLASLVHDIGYQCLREELLLDWSKYDGCIALYYEDWKALREQIDIIFWFIMKNDGAWWITYTLYYKGVQVLGAKYAKPERLKK